MVAKVRARAQTSSSLVGVAQSNDEADFSSSVFVFALVLVVFSFSFALRQQYRRQQFTRRVSQAPKAQQTKSIGKLLIKILPAD